MLTGLIGRNSSFYSNVSLNLGHRGACFSQIRERLKAALPCRYFHELIEAGVDVDFRGISWKCGLDSIVHSAGRCKR
jgi:hypothetical protein